MDVTYFKWNLVLFTVYCNLAGFLFWSPAMNQNAKST